MSGHPSPPTGWYPDPEYPGQLRYWDGTGWTDQRRSAATPPPSPYPTAAGDRTNAGIALALSILGLILCGVLAPIGMVMGRTELQRIDGGGGDANARGMAQAAWIIGLIGTIILVIGVLVLLLFLAVLTSRG
ncbi:MAG: DUF2510 domain-containing protein [Acidimicrobiales bacterium]